MALHRLTATLRNLLVSPQSVFETRTPRQGFGGRVVGLVAAGHALILLGGFFLFAVQISILSDNVGLSGSLGALSRRIPALIGFSLLVFLNWLLVSVVLHVAVKLRHGGGTFGDTLFVVAWSAPIALLVPIAVVGGLSLGVGIAGSPEAFLESADVLRGTIGGLGTLATAVVLCWQGYVWTAGLALTHDMDRGSATFPVIATVVLGIVVMLGT